MNRRAFSQPTENEIRILEETLLDPAVRASSQMLQDLLADSFVEFSASGRTFDKEKVIADLLQQPVDQYTIQDFRMQLLCPGVVLATYQAIRHLQQNQAQYSLRSSIWQYADDRWQMVFHQGTPMVLEGVCNDS